MAFTGTYATVFPVKGQAFEFTGFIKDATTANPIASIGNLTLALAIDGTTASPAGTVAAITSLTGGFKVALTADDMDGNVITWAVTSDTSNAVVACGEIKTVDSSEKSGHWRAQTVLRLEDAIAVPAAYIQNRVTQDNTTNVISVYQYGSTSTTLWTQTDDNTSGQEVKGQAS